MTAIVSHMCATAPIFLNFTSRSNGSSLLNSSLLFPNSPLLISTHLTLSSPILLVCFMKFRVPARNRAFPSERGFTRGMQSPWFSPSNNLRNLSNRARRFFAQKKHALSGQEERAYIPGGGCRQFQHHKSTSPRAGPVNPVGCPAR